MRIPLPDRAIENYGPIHSKSSICWWSVWNGASLLSRVRALKSDRHVVTFSTDPTSPPHAPSRVMWPFGVGMFNVSDFGSVKVRMLSHRLLSAE